MHKINAEKINELNCPFMHEVNIVDAKHHIIYANGVTSFIKDNIICFEETTSFCVRKRNDVDLTVK